MKKRNKTLEKVEKEFFNELAEVLEKLFPKTNYDDPTKPSEGNRGRALVLNARANMLFRKKISQVIEEWKKYCLPKKKKSDAWCGEPSKCICAKTGYNDCLYHIKQRDKKLRGRKK